MKVFAFLLITIISAGVFGQKMFETQTIGCPVKFIMEDNDLIIKYEPNDSMLVVDFLRGFEPKQLEKLKGVIMMQVLVDTLGNVCCVSYSNNSNITDKKLDIENRLKGMPGWQKEADYFENENVCALVNLVFNETEINVIRMGYNRNKGKKQIKYSTFQRKMEKPTIDSLPSKHL